MLSAKDHCFKMFGKKLENALLDVRSCIKTRLWIWTLLCLPTRKVATSPQVQSYQIKNPLITRPFSCFKSRRSRQQNVLPFQHTLWKRQRHPQMNRRHFQLHLRSQWIQRRLHLRSQPFWWCRMSQVRQENQLEHHQIAPQSHQHLHQLISLYSKESLPVLTKKNRLQHKTSLIRNVAHHLIQKPLIPNLK